MFLKSSLQVVPDMRTIQQQVMEDAMKDAMKTLLSHTPKGAMEDLVGVASLFVLLFAVLSVPGLH
jgi:hypothetical protein